jgi:KAP family P-loop domain
MLLARAHGVAQRKLAVTAQQLSVDGQAGTAVLWHHREAIQALEEYLMRLLDDNPTIEDELGFESTAQSVAEMIENASRRPLTIGIFGGWGTGKTSLMQMIEARLKDEGIKTVWFNAWKYSGKEVIWNALIQTILLAMKKDTSLIDAPRRKLFKQRVINVSVELAKYAAKVGTRLIPGGVLREEDIDNLWTVLSSNIKEGTFEFINRFESEFEQLVDEYVGRSYLVVFIDDLDRCLPENAIEVMEALKLYLDKANCVFVIGVEPSIIETAITLRYGANPNLSASRYLEKIIQIPVAVPRARTKSGLDLISSVVGDFIWTRRRRFARLIQVGMDRNPRRIKRFANTFAVALSKWPEATIDEKLVLAKVLIIQMKFSDFYRELTAAPGLLARLQNGDDATAWADADIEHLYNDRELRHFLFQTQDISAPGAAVTRWIRVAQTGEAVEDELADDAQDSGRA